MFFKIQKISISILLISLVSVTFAKFNKGIQKQDDNIMHFNKENQFSKDESYKIDEKNPFHSLFIQLQSVLEIYNIHNINFYMIKSNIDYFNEVSEDITFTYEQDGMLKNGKIKAQANEKGDKYLTEVELEGQEKINQVGGWQEYEIEKGYQADPNSHLSLISSELSKILSEKDFEFLRFDQIKSKLSSGGILFKIAFAYKAKGIEEKGVCEAIVRQQEQSISIKNLSLDNDQMLTYNMIKDDKQRMVGGYKEIKFQTDFQLNKENPINSVFELLNSELKNKMQTFNKFIKIERQLVSGFNYRVVFEYEQDGNIQLGQAIIYSPFSGTPSITNIDLNYKGL